MIDEPWDVQKREKYRDHDLPLEDISERDFLHIRGFAIRDFVETRDSDSVKLIVSSFMSFLTSKGYRIIKKEIK
jgi:hypothetical protein